MPTIYELEVKGEQFANDNGTSRQDIIKHLVVGCRLALSRDIGNLYDANAVKVTLQTGYQVGLIDRAQAQWLVKYLDRGKVGAPVVSNVWYGDRTQALHLWLNVDVESRGEPIPEAGSYAETPGTAQPLVHTQPITPDDPVETPRAGWESPEGFLMLLVLALFGVLLLYAMFA